MVILPFYSANLLPKFTKLIWGVGSHTEKTLKEPTSHLPSNTCSKIPHLVRSCSFYSVNVNIYNTSSTAHKAVVEVSKIGNLSERLVVVNQGWQSEPTDGPKGAWGLLFVSLFLWLSTYLSIFYVSIYLSLSLFHLITYLPVYLSTYLSNYLSIHLSISLSLFHLSICLAVYLSIYLSVYLSICLPVYLWCSVIQCIVV